MGLGGSGVAVTVTVSVMVALAVVVFLVVSVAVAVAVTFAVAVSVAVWVSVAVAVSTDVPAVIRSACFCWKAAIVAASTWPVAGTPSTVCRWIRAAVSSSVQTPSIGPVHNPIRVRVDCRAAVWADCAWPREFSLACSARAVASSTKPVAGRPLSVCSCWTAATVSGP